MPEKKNICIPFLKDQFDYISCCCLGDSCNDLIRFRLDLVKNDEFLKENVSKPNTVTVATYNHYTANWTSGSLIDNSALYAIVLPVILLTLLLLLSLFICCILFKKKTGKRISSLIPQCCPDCFVHSLRLFLSHRSYFGGTMQFVNSSVQQNSSPSQNNFHIVCDKHIKSLSLNSANFIIGPNMKRPIHGDGWLADGEVENISKFCKKLQLRSQGRFGKVWFGCMHLTPSFESGANVATGDHVLDVAIKVFSQSEQRSWEIETEIFRLPRLSHTNILRFIGIDKVICDDINNSGPDSPSPEFWLVTEFLPHGSVYDYINSRELSWGQFLRIASGMARGLSHLHTEQPRNGMLNPKPSIAHRDFKSRNVLLKQDLTACISDLGLAIRFETGHCIGDAHLQVGTRRYMAPEVLDGAIQFTRDAFLRIDVYAMGLVLWELLTRCQSPREACSDEESTSLPLPAYLAPYEAELGNQPTMELMQHWVAQKKKRPQFLEHWANDLGFVLLWETIEDSWDQDAEARLSSGCIAERLDYLQRQFPPSPDDPVHQLASISPGPSPFPLISTPTKDSPRPDSNHQSLGLPYLQHEDIAVKCFPSVNNHEHLPLKQTSPYVNYLTSSNDCKISSDNNLFT